jgi:crotonobetainyl-CoA:carnitine CoA-transferase CaiB-like acyl-CoA transferase
VIVGAFKTNPLQDICNALKLPDMSLDYPTLDVQRANKPLLQQTFQDQIVTNTSTYWLDRLEAQDLLCAPVRSLSEALDDPQTEINGMLCPIKHPVLGDITVIGSPVHLSEAPMQVRHLPPKLGEHTNEVLQELAARLSNEAAE